MAIRITWAVRRRCAGLPSAGDLGGHSCAAPARAAGAPRAGRAAGIPWRERLAGDVVRLGEVTLRIHHPPPAEWERHVVRNDDSMVIELDYGQVSLVLTGDIGAQVEKELGTAIRSGRTPRPEDPAPRKLDVEHSASSSRALRPRVAIRAASAGTTTAASAGGGACGAITVARRTRHRPTSDGAVTKRPRADRRGGRHCTGRHRSTCTALSSSGRARPAVHGERRRHEA